jgi:hypothetical protein
VLHNRLTLHRMLTVRLKQVLMPLDFGFQFFITLPRSIQLLIIILPIFILDLNLGNAV